MAISFPFSSTIPFVVCHVLILFFSLSAWGETSSLQSYKQAEKLFAEQLYEDALPFFSQLLSSVEDEELKTQLTLQLAACHLEKGQPQEALDKLFHFRHHQALYLMSRAYRQLKQSDDALSALHVCSLAPSSQQMRNLIQLEQGYHFMQIGDSLNAEKAFKAISWQPTDPDPYDFAQLQLAKLYLISRQWDAASQILLYPLSNHSLAIEQIYLKGWLALALHQDAQASLYFEQLLPRAYTTKAKWVTHALCGLINSYLSQTLTAKFQQGQALLLKAEAALNQLLLHAPTEQSYLLLIDFYLVKSKKLKDFSAYEKAKELLQRQELFSSKQAQRQVLLKCAQLAPSDKVRHQLYDQLLSDSDASQTFYSQVWFFKGMHHLEKGLKNRKHDALSVTALQQFALATLAFSHAFELGRDLDSRQAAKALKYHALACMYQPNQIEEGWQTITHLIKDQKLLSSFEDVQEIYCLAAWIALHLPNASYLQQAKTFLQQCQVPNPASPHWQECCLKLKGYLHLQLSEWQQAEDTFTQLIRDYPQSAQGEAWFWRAYLAGQQQNLTLKKEYLQQAYTLDPQSPYAPLAYFQLYSYQDYTQGKKDALKHLQAMPLRFPDHPHIVIAYYFIGLTHKKDHFSQEGYLLKRKDWIAAIEAFQQAESSFDTLLAKNCIPARDTLYFLQLRYRSQLERALANFAIARCSNGGKRHIYLEYAEKVFSKIIEDFTSPDGFARKKLVHALSLYPKVWAEAELQLAKLYQEKMDWTKAEAILDQSLAHYRQAAISQSPGLMHVWFEKGMLAQKRNDSSYALQCFIEAEKANVEHQHLHSQEKLEIWIQQSLCYKALDQLDQAMCLLSRVINDDTVSSLRIKAMFLRSEIYELQGRPELALKQLEATANKGGKWAQKAQEKLEQTYGY